MGDSVFTVENSLFKLVDSVMLLFGFFDVFSGDIDKRLSHGMNIEEDLVSGLFGMYIISGKIEVVKSDGTLSRVVHDACNNY